MDLEGPEPQRKMLEPVATIVRAIPRRRLAAAGEGRAGGAARQESGAGVAIVARRRAAALVRDERQEVETVPPETWVGAFW